MARSDLLIALVKAGSAGDKRGVRAAAEAIIAEEHAKQHKVLADRLTRAIQTNGQGTQAVTPASDLSGRGRDFVAEIMPRRRLEDIILPDIVDGASNSLSRNNSAVICCVPIG